MIAVASLVVVPTLATIFRSDEIHSRSRKPIIIGVTILWIATTIIIIITIVIIIGASLTIRVWVVWVSVTLITIIWSIIVRIILNLVIIIIITVVVIVVGLWIGSVSLVSRVVVVCTVVGIWISSRFWPIIPSPALSVVLLIFIVLEEFCHGLYGLNLAASPRSNHLLIIMIRQLVDEAFFRYGWFQMFGHTYFAEEVRRHGATHLWFIMAVTYVVTD